MSEDEYEQNFENASGQGSHNNLDDYNDDQARPGDNHKMRLSIDIHAIKDTTFKGLIYAKYGALPSLGIKPFSAIPAIQITKTNTEEKFKNSFSSYEFLSDQHKLYSVLKEASLEIEVWHQDRFKKDLLIGVANLEIQRVLNAPAVQTTQSFVRTYDAYLPLDEVDDNRNPVKRVALLRTIVYLEDLGPLDYLRAHEDEVISKYTKELGDIATVPAQVSLSHLPGGDINDAEKLNFMNELGNIEYKIIWELENWKKAEEAKFRYQLKSKEVDFLKKLNEEWKKKESEREKTFKKSEAQIQAIENKLKQKTVELQKREQRMVLLEEELKQKINETSRQLAAKDEEVNAVKKKQREEKAQLEKEKTIAVAKKEDFESKFQKLQEEYMTFRREQESSPINLIKNELSAKDLEINRLKGDVEKAIESKRQYETYYERLKAEIVRLKDENIKLRENQARQTAEIDNLKVKLSTLMMQENKENFQTLRNELQGLRDQYDENAGNNMRQSGKNPFTNNLGNSNNSIPKNSLQAARNKSAQARSQAGKPKRPEASTEYERLIQERESLMELGIYTEKDPLIKNLDEQIRRLEA